MSKILKLKLCEDEDENISEGGWSYTQTNIEFAAAKRVGNTITTLRQGQGCRESLCEDYRDSEEVGMDKIPKSRMSMVLYLRSSSRNSTASYNKFKRDMAFAVKIVNIFEKEAGWPLSKMYELSHEYDKMHMFMYVEGSKRWVKAPQLVSLYSLLLRLGHQSGEIGPFRTYNALVKAFKRAKKSPMPTDLHYFKAYHKKWVLILKNYDELFGQRTLKDLYHPKKSGGNWFYTDGINALCDGDTQDLLLRAALRKLFKGRRI